MPILWCYQCGEENVPRQAIGKDDDGEPACVAHAVCQTCREKKCACPAAADSVIRANKIAPLTQPKQFKVFDKGPGNAHHDSLAVPVREEEPSMSCSKCGCELRANNRRGICTRCRTGKAPKSQSPSMSTKRAKPGNGNFSIDLNEEMIDRIVARLISEMPTDRKVELIEGYLNGIGAA